MEHATLYDVLTAWAPTVAAIVAAILAYQARNHASAASAKADDNHSMLNSRLSQLIETTERAAHAAGEAAERARASQELLQSKSEDG